MLELNTIQLLKKNELEEQATMCYYLIELLPEGPTRDSYNVYYGKILDRLESFDAVKVGA